MDSGNPQYKKAFENATTGIVIMDMSGRYLNVNKAFSDMLGYTEDELLSVTFREITDGSDVQNSESILQMMREGNISALSLEKRYRCKCGQLLEAKISSVAILGDDGNPELIITHIQDVTEIKRIQGKLNEKKRELNTLIGNLHGVVYRCIPDEDWTMLYMSEGCRRLTGFSPDVFLNNRELSFLSIIHPDDVGTVSEHTADALAEGNSFSLRYRIIRADGQIKWVFEQGRGVLDPNGDMVIEGYITDITESVELERRYQTLFEGFPYGVADVDSDGRISTMNRAFSWFLEESAQGNSRNLTLDDIIPSCPDKDRIRSAILEGGPTSACIEINGRHVEVTVSSQERYWGKHSSQIIMRDMTELDEAKRRLRMFLDSLDLFAYIKGDDLRYIMVNDSYARFLGLSEDEIIGRRHEELPTPMRMEECIDSDVKVLKDKASIIEEADMQGHILKMRKFPLAVGRGLSGVGAMISDITVRRRMEDSNDFLHHLLSHDLKNKLTVIQGYQDLLRSAEDTDMTSRFLDAMDKAGNDGLQLIEDVEVLRRINSTSETGPISIRVVLRRMEDIYRQRMEDSGMTMVLDIPDDDVIIKGGPLVNELMVNLVENSMLHSDGTRIEIKACDDGDGILITVDDDGKGISEKDRDSFFMRGFKRGKKAGSGLGTYLAQRITEYYDASISIMEPDLGGLRVGIRFQRYVG